MRSRVRFCARCSPRSMLRSIATRREPSDAGAPSHALVPALATSTSVSPRSMAILRAMASDIGLRQVLPVQTNRIFIPAQAVKILAWVLTAEDAKARRKYLALFTRAVERCTRAHIRL